MCMVLPLPNKILCHVSKKLANGWTGLDLWKNKYCRTVVCMISSTR